MAGLDQTDIHPEFKIPGNYILNVSSLVNGCSSRAEVKVDLDTTKPKNVSAGVLGVLTCADTSVTLTAATSSSGVTYSWTDPAGFTSALQNPVVYSSGKYHLVVTLLSTGCTAEDSVMVTSNTVHPTDVTAEASDTIDCNNQFVILSGSSSNPDAVYSWTGPQGFTASDAITFTFISGNYILQALDPTNGCSDTASAVVVVDSVAPVCSISDTGNAPVALDTNIISAGMVNNATYLWNVSSSNPNWAIISGQDTQALTYVAGDSGTSATFSLLVTYNRNGCSSTCQANRSAVSTAKKAFEIQPDQERIASNLQIRVYPNPFKDNAFIDFIPLEDTQVIINLYSVNGGLQMKLFDQPVYAGQSYQAAIDGTKLLPGIYSVIIWTRGQSGSFRQVYSGKLIFDK